MSVQNSRPDVKVTQPVAPAINSQTLVRVVNLFRGFTGVAGLVSLTVLATEGFMPPAYKPSNLIGGFHGRIEAADAVAKAGPVTALTRQNAEAASQPPAFAGMEAEAFRQQQQVLAESLQSKSAIANTADVACAGGRLISPNDRDWGWLGSLLTMGCGVGDRTRQEMMMTLRRGGQENSVLIQRPRANGNGGQ